MLALTSLAACLPVVGVDCTGVVVVMALTEAADISTCLMRPLTSICGVPGTAGLSRP